MEEEKKRYPSDLTEAEWAILEPLVPQAKPGGHPRTVNIREVVNGIFYVLRGGIPWRFLRGLEASEGCCPAAGW
jgi:putative transposase